MRAPRFPLRRPIAILCPFPLLLATAGPPAELGQDEKRVEVTAAAARVAIDAGYRVWGRARVDYDTKTMDSMLAPEFYVLLRGRKIAREKFLADVSRERPGSRLTRFDVDTLTVQKTEAGWTIVISEKIEVTLLGSGSETRKACSMWVTRDGWRNEGGTWLVTFSEAIGHENWQPGTNPPIRHW